MTDTSCPWFVNPCKTALAYLVTEHGFTGPAVKQYAYEVYVEYQKADRWVSVVYEIGYYPLVEFYYPTREIKNRRIPHLLVDSSDLKLTDKFQKKYHKLCSGQKYAEADRLAKEFVLYAEKDIATYMNRIAVALNEQEQDFIQG